MKRLLTVAGAGVLLALGGACAGPQNDTVQPGGAPPALTTEPQPPTSGSGNSDQVPPAGSQPVVKEKMDTAALPKGYPTKVWTQGDGKSVGLVTQEGGCGKAGVEIAEQSAGTVTLLVFEAVPAKPKMCTMDLRYPTMSVNLDQPLGDRKLVLRHERRTY
jgi:hypothetical protein